MKIITSNNEGTTSKFQRTNALRAGDKGSGPSVQPSAVSPKPTADTEKAVFLTSSVSTAGGHRPLAQVPRTHFILSSENANATSKTVAYKASI